MSLRSAKSRLRTRRQPRKERRVRPRCQWWCTRDWKRRTHNCGKKTISTRAIGCVSLRITIRGIRIGFLARPTGSAAAYIVEIGKILSGVSNEENLDEDKGERLENICLLLGITESELKSCEHDTDITKTCRQIIKHIYPNANERAKMLVSSMDPDRLQAVQGESINVNKRQMALLF